jgi:CelD/BcsL family acetyltransferase involved in cellulose biosynthesis
MLNPTYGWPRSADGEMATADSDRAALIYDTVTSRDGFAELEAGWDRLVRAMRRPSPFMLHGWLSAWWAHGSRGTEPQVYVAHRGGELLAALPLCVERRRGLRVARFMGCAESALCVLLLAEGVDPGVGAELAARAAADRIDLADLFGLTASSRLAAALGPDSLRLIEVVESPVLDLSRGWEDTYRAKTNSRKRNQHKRRRRQLATLGRLEVSVARTPEELERAIEESFRVHALRWQGRPDHSSFGTSDGVGFHRAAVARLAQLDVPRIVTLRLDGHTIAFHYYFALEGNMYVHRLAFDPAYGRFSPGLVNTLDALEAASREGLTRVEFLGGAERYKIELADRLEPLHAGLGLAGTPLGRAVIDARLATIRLRRRLKRVAPLHRLYYERLGPMRRAVMHLRESSVGARRARAGRG